MLVEKKAKSVRCTLTTPFPAPYLSLRRSDTPSCIGASSLAPRPTSAARLDERNPRETRLRTSTRRVLRIRGSLAEARFSPRRRFSSPFERVKVFLREGKVFSPPQGGVFPVQRGPYDAIGAAAARGGRRMEGAVCSSCDVTRGLRRSGAAANGCESARVV